MNRGNRAANSSGRSTSVLVHMQLTGIYALMAHSERRKQPSAYRFSDSNRENDTFCYSAVPVFDLSHAPIWPAPLPRAPELTRRCTPQRTNRLLWPSRRPVPRTPWEL